MTISVKIIIRPHLRNSPYQRHINLYLHSYSYYIHENCVIKFDLLYTMASEESFENLRVLTKKMMKAKQIDEYDLNIEGANEKGENYIGQIIFFDVTCKNTDEKYNLVFKTCKQFEGIKKVEEMKKAEDFAAKLYKNEIIMYADIFPRLRSFGNEINSCFELDNVPRIHFFSRETKHESLIIENLKSSGYRLWDRTKPMTLDHVQLVLENYGKFHAVSMAMRDQKQENFEELITGDLLKNLTGDIDDLIKFQRKDFSVAIRVLKEFGRDDLAEKFEEVSNSVKDIFLKYTPEVDRLAVLHGDCWNNNFMFEYKDDESSEPLKMCFLDFQLSHFDSPVKDLSFYIYTACDESTLKHFDLLLETYYASLSSTLKSLGSKPEDLFTMEQLKEHWKKYAIFGLAVCLIFLKMELSTAKDVAAYEKFEKDGVDQSKAFEYKIENNAVYEGRVLDVFLHYADTCF